MTPKPVPAAVRDLLSYDPETGLLLWKVRRGRRAPGDVAGTIGKRGYRIIEIFQSNYLAHRIAWFLMTDEQPTDEIDHANRDRADNRWINLRVATRGQNAANMSLREDSSTGFRGVSFAKQCGKWHAYANVNGKRLRSSYYDSADEAVLAAQRFRAELFGEYAP